MIEEVYAIADDQKARLLKDGERALVRLEQGLGVKLNARSFGLTVVSNEIESVLRACIALDQIVEALKNHVEISDFFIAHLIEQVLQREVKEIAQREHHYPAILRNRLGQAVVAKSEGQLELLKAVQDQDLVFAAGPAGTGKTFLAVALAVAALESKKVERIALVRPAVEAGENLGFLPGDLKEKIAPYLRPLYDSLQELLPKEKFKYYQEMGVIEVAPLAYMRGRTLKKTFVILDEAQNATVSQMKMFLTRLGHHSKAVITGDGSQVDLPTKQISGFEHAIRTLKGVEGIACVRLTDADVQRHPLVRRIIDAYERQENKN